MPGRAVCAAWPRSCWPSCQENRSPSERLERTPRDERGSNIARARALGERGERGREGPQLLGQDLSVTETMASSGLSADAVYAWKSRLRRLAQKLLAELSGKPEP